MSNFPSQNQQTHSPLPRQAQQQSPVHEQQCADCCRTYLSRSPVCPYCGGAGTHKSDTEFTTKIVADNDLMK